MTTTRTRLAVLVAAGAVAAGGLTLGAAQAGAAPAAKALPRCGNDSITVTRTFVQGGAGHSWMSLIYRNSSARTCTISGYPGLDVHGGGHVLAHAARDHQIRPRTVTVRPGSYASATVDWANFAGRTGKTCRTGSSIVTIVPNTTRRHGFGVRVGVCDLQVSPTFAGTPGYPGYAPAQRQWIAGSRADAAHTNIYLRAAAKDLQAAKVYPTQVKQLKELIALPLTSLTKKQQATARRDLAALDAFFATPKLYS